MCVCVCVYILNTKLMVLQKLLLSKEVKTQLSLRSAKNTNQMAKKCFFFPLLWQTNDPKGFFIPFWEAPAK